VSQEPELFAHWSLKKPILQALEESNIAVATSIQRKSYSVIMSGDNVCGIAQTGTGKTIAYLLPLLQNYSFTKDKIPFALIVVPTRELVAQVLATLEQLTAYISLRPVGVYGGANMKINIADLNQGANIVVGTPGRIIDLLANGSLKAKNIRKLVIDEFDEMLELGFRPQLNQILEKIPEKLQFIMYSATHSAEAEVFIDTNARKTHFIEAAGAGSALNTIDQYYVPVPNFYSKISYVKNWVLKADLQKVLIFCGSKRMADLLYQELEPVLGDMLGVIHANKAQNYRFSTLADFEAGAIKFLITTDLLSRGIDVANVSHVLNLDIPTEPENYVHRIGRTGRQGKNGLALSLVAEYEETPWEAINKFLKQEPSLYSEDIAYNVSLQEADFERIAEAPTQNIKLKIALKADYGGAFHDKSEKNSKVNIRRNHIKEKLQKYGKAIKKTRRND
jgi:ATP-dependent RNA helicase RhlE